MRLFLRTVLSGSVSPIKCLCIQAQKKKIQRSLESPPPSPKYISRCRETTQTGESRFHINPPRRFEPESLVAGSKQIVHWTSETWWELCEIAGSPQGSPPAADSVGCEARRETCSERETGTGKLCDQVDLSLHTVSAEPSEAPWGWQSQWSDHVGVTNIARQR
jgi:hypothetical protein